LGRRFEEKAPIGSATRNFADSFHRLDRVAGPNRVPGPERPGDPGDGPAGPGGSGLVQRLVLKLVWPVVEPLVDGRDRTTRLALGRLATEVSDGGERTEEALTETVEAFRFLAARVGALEAVRDAAEVPVDGPALLVAPPDLSPVAGPVAAWLADRRPRGPAVHAECGTGDLLAALGQAGLAAAGYEPRPEAGLAAAERGHEVHPGGVDNALAAGATAPGALILSGAPDRLPLAELVGLLERAGRRLEAGSPLVVTSGGVAPAPGTEAAVLRDLLPGRPLDAATWILLLERGGWAGIERLVGEGGAGTPYAVAALAPGR
jgi:hypothetical protein